MWCKGEGSEDWRAAAQLRIVASLGAGGLEQGLELVDAFRV